MTGVDIEALGFDDLDGRTAYALWRLRQDVFVVEQASPYPDLDGRDLDPTTRHVLLRLDGDLAGCARVVDDGDCVRISRVALAAAARGRGLGDALVDATLAAAEALAAGRELRLDAQTRLAGWYERWGFAVCGPEFDDGGVAHLPMLRPSPGS